MLVIQSIRPLNHRLVEPIVPLFSTADQQECNAPRVQRIENPIRLTAALKPQFPEASVHGIGDSRAVRKRELGALGFEQPHCDINRVLLLGIQAGSPLSKLIGVLHLPRH